MESILWWLLIVALYLASLWALKYPWLPGVLFLFGGYSVYGFAFGFDTLGWGFWIVQLTCTVFIYITDFFATNYALKMHGGSPAAMRGSIIGLIFGPFVIPGAGFVAGPFIGAVLAEYLFNRRSFRDSIHIGLGSLIGLFGSILLKGLIQTAMFFLFILWIVLPKVF